MKSVSCFPPIACRISTSRTNRLNDFKTPGVVIECSGFSVCAVQCLSRIATFQNHFDDIHASKCQKTKIGRGQIILTNAGARNGRSNNRLLDFQSKIGEPPIRVTETIESDAHSVHQRQIKTARTSIVVATFEVVQVTPGLQRSSASAGE